eukprot:TRINITY_DN8058_c2_g1_i1.p1 TRINITY_DN8058_c2_g1~~TRINITY_DN8058_c2_g1_i1.p1  ORF type:complete len:380 (+),score=93.83 TRINITY_DN8058_c2_g1_i1:252-1391(+)
MVKFTMPTDNDIAEAIASPAKLTRTQQAVATGGLRVADYYGSFLSSMAASGDYNIVPPMVRPESGDWLESHKENGQPFKRFLARPSTVAPHGKFSTIALVVLGDGLSRDVLNNLRRYVSAFYQLDVELVGPVDVESGMRDGSIGSTVNAYTQQDQMFCKDAMRAATAAVESDRSLMRRTIATMAVTMIDLTPNEQWNFVYGQASLTEARGVFSLARFSPSFNGENVTPAEADRLILERACKVVTHELGHIFGLLHCIYFTCLMNGANHFEEMKRQPLQECPVCLKKLLHSFGWDLRLRYTQLAVLCEELKLGGSAAALIPMVMQHHASRADVPKPLGAMYTAACLPAVTDAAVAAAAPRVPCDKKKKISHRRGPAAMRF